ncbi:MAG TPA: hypothetical protein VJ914_04070, partial [Pseudonocardiaceae bacterium]|nr:hypothetical protein [Pseudonocardiaceae bacterium]
MPTTLTSRVLISAALALGATLLTTGVALAAPPGGNPDPGDNRATAHAGNAVNCAEAGLPDDTTITLSGLEDKTGTYVTISAKDIPSGDTLLAVVVKGGPAYNVYQGLSAWTLLHSPINPGGQIPTISHWFACVSTGTTTTTKSTTTTTCPPTTTATGGTTTTTASSSSTTGATSTSGTTVAAGAGNGNTPNGPGT